MIKKFSIIIIVLVFVMPGYSQVINSGDNMSFAARQLQKLRWDMRIGTSYTHFSNFGGMMNYYAAPGFTYPINERFSFHGGVMAGVTTHPRIPGNESAVHSIQSGYTSVYGSVVYSLNSKVSFYGTGVKSIANFGSINPMYLNSFDEISIGSTVRLGNNVSIGASVSFRNYNGFNEFYSPFFEQDQ